MSIHQQATIPADPGRVYQVLADVRALSALSGTGGRAAWPRARSSPPSTGT
ncbi:MAG: hypothetical protein ABSA02_21765 [Trebonia sp.]